MICNKCELDKPEDEFQFRDKSKGIRKKQCKSCVKNYREEYYSNNRDKAIEYSKITTKDRRIKSQQYVWDYLLKNPCVDCGESDPIVLEFDHKDDVEKVLSISRATQYGWSLEKLQEEIDKCDVRCSNCHKRRTAIQFDWYKNISV